jgi:hypothetical protein
MAVAILKPVEDQLTLRLARPADTISLERLAQLDSRRLAPGPHLVAERGGIIDAALSLSSGELAADPFQPTAELCDLLLKRAAQLRGSPHPRIWRKPHLRLRLLAR